MLLNNLYSIQSLSETEQLIHVLVELNTEHDIFKGHFPGQPVLPGVCMMEMIKEITGEHLSKSFRISGASMIKFLRMIDPRKTASIRFEIKYETTPAGVSTSGRIYMGSEVFMKFSLDLTDGF